MSWNCAGCGCHYVFSEADESHGVKLCEHCVDDDETIETIKKKAQEDTDRDMKELWKGLAIGTICFMIGALFGRWLQ